MHFFDTVNVSVHYNFITIYTDGANNKRYANTLPSDKKSHFYSKFQYFITKTHYTSRIQ